MFGGRHSQWVHPSMDRYVYDDTRWALSRASNYGDRTIVLGGCIELRSPSEHSVGCKCYQVQVPIWHSMMQWTVCICREWLRYYCAAYGERQHDVISRLITSAFDLNRFPWRPCTEAIGERAREICSEYRPHGSAGHPCWPTHLKEVCMMNKYGYLVNWIELPKVLESFASPDFTPYKLHAMQGESHYPGKNFTQVLEINREYFNAFVRTLLNIPRGRGKGMVKRPDICKLRDGALDVVVKMLELQTKDK